MYFALFNIRKEYTVKAAGYYHYVPSILRLD